MEKIQQLLWTFNILKKNAKSLPFYITVIFGFLAFSTLAVIAYEKLVDKTIPNQKKIQTVILDPGHGGEDGGAIGKNGAVEKDINLAICFKLKPLLEATGIKVIMTRESDTAIYDEYAVRAKKKKKSDLNNRLKIIKNNSNDNTIFISVHQNNFADSKYWGSQIFYSPNSEQSSKLAGCIQKSIISLIQPKNKRNIKEAPKSIFLLKHCEIAGIIIECGFLSNDEEEKKLLTQEYQRKLIFCIYVGIVNYFNEL